MKIFENSKESRKDLANNYTMMMETVAWKDIEKFIEYERDTSMKMMDAKPASGVSVGEYCEERGYRKGLNRIIQYANQRREGV